MADIKLVAFDVDGVLRESSRLFYECHKSAMDAGGIGREFRRHFDAREMWHFKGLGRFNDRREAIKALYVLAKAGRLEEVHGMLYRPDAEKRISRLVSASKVQVDERLVDSMLERYKEMANSPDSGNLVKIYPGTAETVRKLKKSGLKLVIFTNASMRTVDRDLKSIRKYFDYVITPDNVKKAKPSGEGIVLISKRSGVRITEMAYVGDTVIDMRAARDAKCRSIAVCCGMGLRQHLEREKPDVIVRDLKAASKWILKNSAAELA